MADEYLFDEQPALPGEIRLMWRKRDRLQDELDFWIIPDAYVEEAKERVRSGEFDWWTDADGCLRFTA